MMPDDKPEPTQLIIDESDLRKYRTELPNMVDDAELDPYEFRLYVHYKRVGRCTENVETTAMKCRMSEGKVSECRQQLADKGWVRLERVPMDQSRYRFIVHVIDRWMENFATFSGVPLDEIIRQVKRGSASPREGSPSPHEASPSRGEGKKELIKNLSSSSNNGDIFEKYEQEFGALTPMIADAINDDCDTFSAAWVKEAMVVAVGANRRSWNYVRGILKQCQAAGKSPFLSQKERKHGNNGSGNRAGTKPARPAKTSSSAGDGAARAVAERIKKRRADVQSV
jgi:DnaD/phage-associated family protein